MEMYKLLSSYMWEYYTVIKWEILDLMYTRNHKNIGKKNCSMWHHYDTIYVNKTLEKCDERLATILSLNHMNNFKAAQHLGRNLAVSGCF